MVYWGRLTLLLFCLTAVGRAETVETRVPQTFNFGVAERFTFRDSHAGINLSMMAACHPTYRLNDLLDVRGLLGLSAMNSLSGSFLTARYQLGMAFNRLTQKFYPEFLFGFETWATTLGGTYPTLSLNLHYRVRFSWEKAGVFEVPARYLDSISLGYTYVVIPGDPANQVMLSFRFAPEHEPLAQKEYKFPTPSPEPETKVEEKTLTVGVAPAPTPTPKPKTKTIEMFTGKLGNIDFKPGSDVLLRESYPVLDQVVDVLQKHPELGIEIQGHTDNSGSEELNLKLSQRRTESVKEYLLKKNIDESRLRAVGFGSELPVADNETEEGRAQNRRVEFHIIAKEKDE